MSSLHRHVIPYIELCKVNIAFFATFSAATGFILSAGHFAAQIFVVMTGIFFLACGASALNQYQERDIDAQMPRTRNRPIPLGRIGAAHALYFSLIMISSGTLALLLTGTFSASLLGLSAVIWYNGVYTFLKKKSAFAVIPGALVGTIPVAVGWTTGGSALNDPTLLMICFFFFMWQVPHSWLFILKYGDEYKMAGLPSLTALFSDAQLSRINFIWMSAAAVSCLLICRSGAIRNGTVKVSLFVLSAWLVWNGARLLGARGGRSACSPAFRRVNFYMFFVMSLLTIGKLFF